MLLLSIKSFIHRLPPTGPSSFVKQKPTGMPAPMAPPSGFTGAKKKSTGYTPIDWHTCFDSQEFILDVNHV